MPFSSSFCSNTARIEPSCERNDPGVDSRQPGVKMQAQGKNGRFLHSKAPLATAAFLTFALPPSFGGSGQESWVPPPAVTPQSTCTFADGSTMTFGAGKSASAESWHTGVYDATTLRVSEEMLIPPMDKPLRIPAGTYTIFVMDEGRPPWTLIVSKKTGEWGMSYPGEEYDLGRTDMGSDVKQPVDKFVIGCTNSGTMLVLLQSGRFSGLLKILAVNPKEGYVVR
jgi:hypothetical protein